MAFLATMVATAAGPKTNPMIKQRLAGVRLQGHEVPFHRTGLDAYTYLGVPLTLTLNYMPYMARMLSDLRERLDKLDASFAGPRQRLCILHTCIVPRISYGFPIMPCNLSDLDKI